MVGLTLQLESGWSHTPADVVREWLVRRSMWLESGLMWLESGLMWLESGWSGVVREWLVWCG